MYFSDLFGDGWLSSCVGRIYRKFQVKAQVADWATKIAVFTDVLNAWSVLLPLMTAVDAFEIHIKTAFRRQSAGLRVYGLPESR